MCPRDKVILISLLMFVLIQCCIHMMFCVWGVNLMKCKNIPEEKKGPKYFLYLTYFLNSTCLEATLEEWIPEEHNNVASGQTLFNWTALPDTTFPEQSPARSRTYFIFELYILLNSILIATTLLLLVGVCFNVKGRLSLVFYVPWLLVMFVVIVCDMVVLGLYLGDIPATYGLRKWHHFLNKDVDDQVVYKLNLVASYTRTAWPAIFMAAAFGRFIVFLFLNICLFFYIKHAAVAAYQKRRPVSHYLISASCGTITVVPKMKEDETGKIQK